MAKQSTEALPIGKLIPRQLVETQEMHCGGCGRFLGFQAVLWGSVKIKCHNCKEWTTIDIRPEKD